MVIVCLTAVPFGLFLFLVVLGFELKGLASSLFCVSYFSNRVLSFLPRLASICGPSNVCLLGLQTCTPVPGHLFVCLFLSPAVVWAGLKLTV
jgi:hypothetical protein